MYSHMLAHPIISSAFSDYWVLSSIERDMVYYLDKHIINDKHTT